MPFQPPAPCLSWSPSRHAPSHGDFHRKYYPIPHFSHRFCRLQHIPRLFLFLRIMFTGVVVMRIQINIWIICMAWYAAAPFYKRVVVIGIGRQIGEKGCRKYAKNLIRSEIVVKERCEKKAENAQKFLVVSRILVTIRTLGDLLSSGWWWVRDGRIVNSHIFVNSLFAWNLHTTNRCELELACSEPGPLLSLGGPTGPRNIFEMKKKKEPTFCLENFGKEINIFSFKTSIF